jgi:hypothetical protein
MKKGKNAKRILVTHFTGEGTVKEVYNSSKELAEKIGCDISNIYDAIKKGRPIRGRFKVSYFPEISNLEENKSSIYDEIQKKRVFQLGDLPDFLKNLKIGESVLCLTSGDNREVSIIYYTPQLGYVDIDGNTYDKVTPIYRSTKIKSLESDLKALIVKKKEVESRLDSILESIRKVKSELRSYGVR